MMASSDREVKHIRHNNVVWGNSVKKDFHISDLRTCLESFCIGDYGKQEISGK